MVMVRVVANVWIIKVGDVTTMGNHHHISGGCYGNCRCIGGDGGLHHISDGGIMILTLGLVITTLVMATTMIMDSNEY